MKLWQPAAGPPIEGQAVAAMAKLQTSPFREVNAIRLSLFTAVSDLSGAAVQSWNFFVSTVNAKLCDTLSVGFC